MTLADLAPIVSVVIPTYNRPDLLRLAVASVLVQTVRDIEIIVVDDASHCDNKTLLDEFGDGRVRYARHASNKRLPGARNTGVAMARGRFIAFLDDDDRWLPGKLQAQLAVADRYDAVLCGCFINEPSRLSVYPVADVTVRDLRRGNPFPPSGYLVRADVMRTLGFDERLRFGEDWDLLMRLACGHRLYNLREPLFVRTVAEHETMTNALRSQGLDYLESTLLAIQKHREVLGPFWFNYRVAYRLLSYIGTGRDRVARLRHAVSRCGRQAVARVIFDKATARLRNSRI